MTSKIFKSKRFKKFPHSDYWDYYRHKTLPIIIYVAVPNYRRQVMAPFQIHYSLYCQCEEEEKYVNNGEAAELKLSGTVPKILPSDVELNLLILYKLGK